MMLMASKNMDESPAYYSGGSFFVSAVSIDSE